MAEELMTELKAVNAMLGTIGEAPVNSLIGALPADVQSAYDILNETSRDVQSDGWGFNTEYEVRIVPDVNGLITLAGNTLKIDLTVEDSSVDPVQRGLKLYDRKKHTYVFTKSLDCDVVYYLTWNELPEQARRYIMIKAARVFQARSIGSDTLNGFTEREEAEALAKLKGSDDENTDYSIFDNYSTYRIVHRRK